MGRALRLGLDRADARALAAVSAVRLLLMPLASIALVKGASRPPEPALSVLLLAVLNRKERGV